jgi:hypothetical protein
MAAEGTWRSTRREAGRGKRNGEEPAALETLRRFRADLYGCRARRADALFELADTLVAGHAVATAPPPHLSLESAFRRGWGSTYGALRRGRIAEEAARDLLAAWRPAGWPAVFAVDASSWARCDAECSPERGYYHHPSRHSNGQPIVAGWNYSWIAGLNWEPNSWTAPLDVRRIHPTEEAGRVTAAQVEAASSAVAHITAPQARAATLRLVPR